MRLSSIGYLIKEGFRNIKQNSFMSIASVLVLVSCLLLTGAAYLVFVNVEQAFNWAYSQNTVVVWAVETADDAQVDALGAQLSSMNNIASVEKMTKEEILESFSDEIPEATFETLKGENNPMLDAFVVSFKDLDTNLFNSTLNNIQALENVDSVSHYQDVANVLTNIRSAVFSIGAWIIAMLLFVSLFIISNTIKLTVYSRRLEINIMKSVGATKAFIRLPFIVEGMALGMMSALLSFGIIYFVYTRLITTVSMGMIHFSELNIVGMLGVIPVWAELLLGFILMGTLTGMVGSAFSIGRYLKEESGVSID